MPFPLLIKYLLPVTIQNRLLLIYLCVRSNLISTHYFINVYFKNIDICSTDIAICWAVIQNEAALLPIPFLLYAYATVIEYKRMNIKKEIVDCYFSSSYLYLALTFLYNSQTILRVRNSWLPEIFIRSR